MKPKILLLIAALLATTLTISYEQARACVHPHPCGDEWPAGLEGPFALREVQYVRVPVPADYDDPAAGTIELEGWIGLPDLPPGVGAPVALSASPYNGQCVFDPIPDLACPLSPADANYWWSDPPARPLNAIGPKDGWGVAPIELIKRGYAAAFFSVRGTGNSGGCWEYFGENERRDQRTIVDYLGSRPWSNGRVGMGGISYLAGTAFEAAVTPADGEDHLKTVVMTGIMTDLYTLLASPQGAFRTIIASSLAMRFAEITLLPPLTPALSSLYAAIPVEGEGTGEGFQPENLQYFLDHLGVRKDRACPEVERTVVGPPKDQLTDVRDKDFYDERRLLDHVDNFSAALLMAHGFLDRPPHGFQENTLWNALDGVPKRQIEGPWAHEWPDTTPATALDPSWANNTWTEVVFNWLDYWLKGIGSPERLGKVDYRVGAGAWRENSAWPPTDAHDEVLYLTGGSLATMPAAPPTVPRTFRSAPHPGNSYHNLAYLAGQAGLSPQRPWAAVCSGTGPPDDPGLLYLSEPLASPLVLAGNPFAYLQISADMPGGIVTLNMLDVGPDFACDAAGQPSGIRELTAGGADLRFHHGNFIADPFPTGTPTPVRIDLFDLAETIPAGHRIGLVVSYGDTYSGWTSASPYFPRVTINDGLGNASSQLILPIVEGTLGGTTPAIAYPPRPFVP